MRDGDADLMGLCEEGSWNGCDLLQHLNESEDVLWLFPIANIA